MRTKGATNLPKGTMTFTDKEAIDFTALKHKVKEMDKIKTDNSDISLNELLA